MLRFHIPLIKPDVRISRIRLSDKVSRFRPREIACPLTQSLQTQLPVQVLVRKACRASPADLVFGIQPLAEPATHVAVHDGVGRTHRSQTEVVGPTDQFTVDLRDPVLGVDETPSAACHVADLAAEPLDLLLRRTRANIGSSRLWRITTTDGVTEEVK